MKAPHPYEKVSLPLPKVRVINSVKLRYSRTPFRTLKYAECDGVLSEVKSGAWAFYIPDQKMKLLHARRGKQTCLHKVARRFTQLRKAQAHENAQARESGVKIGNYFVQDWESALNKSVPRRIAETWIAARRLAKAGLGPDVSDIVIVREFQAPYARTPCMTAGFIQDNAWDLPAGPHAEEAAMIAAGVKPDQIRSCIRQPINGYVTDLNSVVGVEPLNAETEIEALTAHIKAI